MTVDAITEWLNKGEYITVRGKQFSGAHVHSILKKRLAKEELLNRECPLVWSDFSMEVMDKTILMRILGFQKRRNEGGFETISSGSSVAESRFHQLEIYLVSIKFN